MRGPTDAEDERRAYAEQSSLTALVGHLGRNVEVWLQRALEPLPETFRISLHRNDRQWTVDQVKALGAVALPWMPDDTAFAMPFHRGRAPEGLAQRMMALLHETGRITRQEAASMLPVRLLPHRTEGSGIGHVRCPWIKNDPTWGMASSTRRRGRQRTRFRPAQYVGEQSKSLGAGQHRRDATRRAAFCSSSTAWV